MSYTPFAKNKSPIDGIVSSLKKIEDKLRAYSAAKKEEESEAIRRAEAANEEAFRANKIAENLARLLDPGPGSV